MLEGSPVIEVYLLGFIAASLPLPQRVRAHIFVAAFAFLLDRALEEKLKAAGVYERARRRSEVGARSRRSGVFLV